MNLVNWEVQGFTLEASMLMVCVRVEVPAAIAGKRRWTTSLLYELKPG